MSQQLEDQRNYDVFRDCVEGPIIQKLLIPPRKLATNKKARGRKNSPVKAKAVVDIEDDAEDFAEFIDVIYSLLSRESVTELVSVLGHRDLLVPTIRTTDLVIPSYTGSPSAHSELLRSNPIHKSRPNSGCHSSLHFRHSPNLRLSPRPYLIS